MSWTRRLIWAFWIFIAVMLLWQFYNFNNKISAPSEHPSDGHFFFYQHTAGTPSAVPIEHDGPFVEQTRFRTDDGGPQSTTFTCYVTLKNTGKAKAVNVEVCVRPYRGTMEGDEDVGPNSDTPMSDDNPRAQINQWVTFPDLAPGEESTQSATFMKSGAPNYGTNPRAEIVYQPEKK
jgi:hypothetical protein